MSKEKRQIEKEDLIPDDIYVKNRKKIRKELVEFKKDRRIAIGPYATFYFESFETMLGQIQEMLHIEKGGDEQLEDELKRHSSLSDQEIREVREDLWKDQMVDHKVDKGKRIASDATFLTTKKLSKESPNTNHLSKYSGYIISPAVIDFQLVTYTKLVASVCSIQTISYADKVPADIYDDDKVFMLFVNRHSSKHDNILTITHCGEGGESYVKIGDIPG